MQPASQLPYTPLIESRESQPIDHVLVNGYSEAYAAPRLKKYGEIQDKMRSEPTFAKWVRSSSCFCCLLVKEASAKPVAGSAVCSTSRNALHHKWLYLCTSKCVKRLLACAAGCCRAIIH